MRAKHTPVQNGVTTIYPSTSLRAGSGALYEKNLNTGEVTTYYFARARLIAVRTQIGSACTLNFLHSDHLGSTSLATNASGAANIR